MVPRHKVKLSSMRYTRAEKPEKEPIPESDLEFARSQRYKEIIQFNKGQPLTSFGLSQRFRNVRGTSTAYDSVSPPTLHQQSSPIQLLTKEPTADFGKQSARKPLFLSPDQLDLMADKKQIEDERLAKAQRYGEEIRSNERKYAVGKTWRQSFEYQTHHNVKKFMPYMREMLKQVRGNAEAVRLSHYDATNIANMA